MRRKPKRKRIEKRRSERGEEQRERGSNDMGEEKGEANRKRGKDKRFRSYSSHRLLVRMYAIVGYNIPCDRMGENGG